MIYESNISEVVEKLKKGFLNPETQDKLARIVALTLYSSNMRRIHNEGMDVDEKPIGIYSIRPIYVNPKVSPVKFIPKTKVKINPVTRYFPGGYKQFRGYIGRKTDKVNVDLSHKLKEDWRIFYMGPGHYTIGFQSEYGKNVSHGNENHFKTRIWGVTVQDRKMIVETVKNFIHAAA